jgi:signal transduction histidine kinase
MPPRPRRAALGLRGRIVGAVLVTTVATLAVAAVALLGPLQQSLRNVAKTALRADLRTPPGKHTRSPLHAFVTLHLKLVADSQRQQKALINAQNQLALMVGASHVTLLGYFGPPGAGYIMAPQPNSDLPDPDTSPGVAKAYRTSVAQFGFTSLHGAEFAQAAVPLEIGKTHYVVDVLKPVDDVGTAVHAVRTAFIYAALAGLALTLILAIPLSARLVRRLRQLRHAAVQVALGKPAELPVDRARDEVGDLARTFDIMQHRLQQQEEARRAFVATASHELRTPLTSLDGMLELLDDDLQQHEPDVQDARALVERARVQSRRLGRLAADLLDLSRLDAAVELRSEPVELGELSRAVMAEFELGTSESGITPELIDGDGPVWALGDPGSVARIIRILLDNAVRVSPSGSEITITVHGGDAVELSVSDLGPGVSPDERNLIFERFQRGRKTSDRAGFGLGLAIGRELAERMGGELVLDDGYRDGARFTLKLPPAHAPDHDPVAIV